MPATAACRATLHRVKYPPCRYEKLVQEGASKSVDSLEPPSIGDATRRPCSPLPQACVEACKAARRRPWSERWPTSATPVKLSPWHSPLGLCRSAAAAAALAEAARSSSSSPSSWTGPRRRKRPSMHNVTEMKRLCNGRRNWGKLVSVPKSPGIALYDTVPVQLHRLPHVKCCALAMFK